MDEHLDAIRRRREGVSTEVLDAKERNGWDTEECNIQIVLRLGFVEVSGRLRREVRAALMSAVKTGRLGRLKKGHGWPEIFYRPESRPVAMAAKNQSLRRMRDALIGIVGGIPDI